MNGERRDDQDACFFLNFKRMCSIERVFISPSPSWQRELCENFSFRYEPIQIIYRDKPVPLQKPQNFFLVKGDGNCFFRALSYSLSGTEENHLQIRRLIIDHLKENKDGRFKGLLRNQYQSCEQYIENSKMQIDGTWATEVEVFVGCSLFQINIFIFSKFGDEFKWLEFKPGMLSKNAQCSVGSVYLYHKGGCHYDVVTNVHDISLESQDIESENNSCNCNEHADPLGISFEENLTTQTGLKEDKLGISLDLVSEKLGVSLDLSVSLSEDVQSVSSHEDIKMEEDPYEFEISSEDLKMKQSPLKAVVSPGDLRIEKDPFKFSMEDTTNLSYSQFKRKAPFIATSTPKKTKINKENKSFSNLSEASMNDSSFEEEMTKMKIAKSKTMPQHSKLLEKALASIESSFVKARECNTHCLYNLSEESFRSARYRYWTKTFENRVNWFIDKVAEGKKKGNKVIFFADDGRKLCSSCFCLLYNIDKNFYYKYLRKAKEGSEAYGVRKGRGIIKRTEGAIRWLKDYADSYADKMPDTGDFLLPYKYRKKMLYDAYVHDKTENMEISVGPSTFYDIWKTNFPKLKIKKTNAFSKCGTCVSIEKEMSKTRDQKKREKLKKMMTVHNFRQMRERRHYYEKRERAKREMKKYLSIIIDGMDQSKTDLPHFTGRVQKGIDPSNLLKTHVQGVINHGRGTFTTYIDICEYPHDANLVMNVLLRSIYDSVDKNGALPGVLYIQADNCARENKNRFVLGFCELLVKLEIFQEVHLSFLYVGHTHEDIDASFATLSEKLRQQDAETIPKLQAVLNGARRIQGLYNIKQWIEPYLNNVSKHSKPLHYRFLKSNHNDTMAQFRANSARPWRDMEMSILSGIPTGKPSILVPSNFHKINTDALRANIEKYRYQFPEENQHKWWMGFLSEIEELKRCPEKLQEYAASQAVWLLPNLMKANTYIEPDIHRLPQHLVDVLDRDLDDPQVEVKLPRGSRNQSEAQCTKGVKEKQKLYKRGLTSEYRKQSEGTQGTKAANEKQKMSQRGAKRGSIKQFEGTQSTKVVKGKQKLTQKGVTSALTKTQKIKK